MYVHTDKDALYYAMYYCNINKQVPLHCMYIHFIFYKNLYSASYVAMYPAKVDLDGYKILWHVAGE